MYIYIIIFLADPKDLIKWHTGTSKYLGPNNQKKKKKMSTFPLNYVAINMTNPRLLMMRVYV